MAITISTHFGSAVARGHNRRDPKVVASQSHINPNGKHEVWRDLDLKAVYESVFGDAVKEFNSHARPDRQVSNYLAQVRKSSRKHEVYEEIATIGSLKNMPSNAEGREMLKEYVDTWQRRNPHMVMVGAYYHADEQGAPHVHIDFVPVGTGYKRGMSMQSSYSRALDNMGFHGRGAAALWWRSENDALEDICVAHGFEVTHPMRGRGSVHQDTSTFKEMQAAALEHSDDLSL